MFFLNASTTYDMKNMPRMYHSFECVVTDKLTMVHVPTSWIYLSLVFLLN